MSPPRRGGGIGHPGPDDDGWPPTPHDEEAERVDRGDWEPWEREWRPPIPVEGGIVAATRRGRIGSTWWSRRFLDALESVLVGGRMASGRAYARKGQVVALHVLAGVVDAPVQGSREVPYEVRLVMPVVPDESWERIVDRLASQAGYAARMLAGDLPHEIDDVFEAEGESLLPAPHSRLTTSCTCPDFENPCKHIAAVCYLLAESFDRDPFELLAWRGRGREAILEELRARRSAVLGAASAEIPPDEAEPTGPAARDGRTSAPAGRARAARARGGSSGEHVDASTFYGAGPELEEVRVAPVAASVPSAVVCQLRRGILEVDGEDVRTLLGPAYEAFSADAARRATRP